MPKPEGEPRKENPIDELQSWLKRMLQGDKTFNIRTRRGRSKNQPADTFLIKANRISQPKPSVTDSAEISQPQKTFSIRTRGILPEMSQPINQWEVDNKAAADHFVEIARRRVADPQDNTVGYDPQFGKFYRNRTTGLTIIAQQPEHIQNGWLLSSGMRELAEKLRMPIAIYNMGGNHFTLILKGPQIDENNNWSMLIYNPFTGEERVPLVNNSGQTFAQYAFQQSSTEDTKLSIPKVASPFMKTKKVRTDADNSMAQKWIEQFTVTQNNRRLTILGYHPEGMHLPLARKTYDLTLPSDAPFTPRVREDKAQPLQNDGCNCGLYTIYAAMIRNAALVSQSEFKQIGLPLIQQWFNLEIFTAEQANQLR